ncbi:MAG: galactose mutarotase [bacterium]|nr:galactose mutarotase [bacterium]
MKSSAFPLAAVALAACSAMPTDPATRSVSQRPFGIDQNDQPATLWTLRAKGLEIDVTDHGATLVAVRVPDAAGTLADVILGFDDVSGYESDSNQYFGCTTGRVCNRIAQGRFTLDGEEFRLAVNNGPNHLHGGAVRSLDKVHWQTEVIDHGSAPAIRFTYRSPEGEEGYPGALEIRSTYRLDDEGLHMILEATTDRRTPVNLTNHAYWNLSGAGADTVLDHELQIHADEYTPTDDTLVPTGAIAPVASALDFRERELIGARINSLDDSPAAGYDHNYVLRDGDGMRHAATLRNLANGRRMDVYTDQPGLQLYSGNWLSGQTGKGGKSYPRRSAVCLETQFFPDSVNQPAFPSTILDPGATYRSTTTIRFANR